jgi:DNA-binding helix-hairpin-helix protein with protein kinase domain
LIQPVDRTILLEIVHSEVKKYFLKCFNDWYKNPNMRPTAKEWMQVLKVGSNELNVCKMVDSYYYSQTYGIEGAIKALKTFLYNGSSL